MDRAAGARGCGAEQTLPIDWDAIAAGGQTKTNYQILPGDRLYIVDDSLVAMNNYLDFFINPVERLLNISSWPQHWARSGTLRQAYKQRAQTLDAVTT